MNRQRRTSLAFGLILLLLGAWFLALQLVPSLEDWVAANFEWPLFTVGAGALLLLIALVTGVPDLAVPAAITAGIGGLLYWQNATGNWASWSYAWALIPGFAGVGVVLSGLLGQNTRANLREGLRLMVISLVLFFVFASLLGGVNYFGPYWPVLLILLGLWLLVQPFLRGGRSSE
jgi:hypothetical protein